MQNQSKKHRRLFRFGLRSLLLAMLVVGLLLGWKADRAHRQYKAAQKVFQMGGSYCYAYEGPFAHSPHGLHGPKLPKPAPDWLIRRLGIDYFDKLVTVDLPEAQVDLDLISTLTDLRRLNLNSAKGFADISPLRQLSDLEWLVLSGTEVTDLSPLGDLSKLKILWLRETNVADLSPLSSLTQLRSLDLSSTPVEDFSVLSKFKQLQVLSVWDTNLSDVTALRNLTSLLRLDLRNTKVNDLTPLVELKELTIILKKDQAVHVPKQLEPQVRRY